MPDPLERLTEAELAELRELVSEISTLLQPAYVIKTEEGHVLKKGGPLFRPSDHVWLERVSALLPRLLAELAGLRVVESAARPFAERFRVLAERTDWKESATLDGQTTRGQATALVAAIDALNPPRVQPP